MDYEIEIDEGNEEHLTAHGVTVAEVHQVFANAPVVRKNRKGRAAEFIAQGVTDGGSEVVIPFNRTDNVIRPITAWRP